MWTWLCQWLAWKLPRRLVYFAAIRMWAHTTQGPWENEIVTSVRRDEALQRWEAQDKPKPPADRELHQAAVDFDNWRP